MPPGFAGFVEPGLSFSPEKTQIELACDVAATFSVPLPGGPITSLAKAALALAPASAAVQTATASNGFMRMLTSHLETPLASRASPGSIRQRPYSDPAGANCDIAHEVSRGKTGAGGKGRIAGAWPGFNVDCLAVRENLWIHPQGRRTAT